MHAVLSFGTILFFSDVWCLTMRWECNLQAKEKNKIFAGPTMGVLGNGNQFPYLLFLLTICFSGYSKSAKNSPTYFPGDFPCCVFIQGSIRGSFALKTFARKLQFKLLGFPTLHVCINSLCFLVNHCFSFFLFWPN